LSVRYANGADEGRGGNVTVNGNSGTAANVSMPNSGGWTSWKTATASIVLEQGSNLIKLTSTGGGGLANIDSISLTGAGALAEPCGNVSSSSSSSSSSGNNASSSSSSSSTSTGGTAQSHAVKPVGYGAGTTGAGGRNRKTVSSMGALRSALKSNTTVVVNGTISGSGEIKVKEVSNITVIGSGNNGKLRGVGIVFSKASNIIVQNLNIHQSGSKNKKGDSLAFENTTRAWIDHNDISTDVDYTKCDTSSSVKNLYDGQLDIKKNSRNITVSFNYIHDACKAMLLGFSDGKETDNNITYHHNRFERVGSRLPLIRSATTHVYNNYYKDIIISGINVRMGAKTLIENNYFENVDDPILSADSKQIGYWNVSGNIYAPNGPTYTHKIEKQDKVGEVVNGEVKSTTNFRVNYNYKLDKANDVPPTVIRHAGSGKI